MKEFLFFKHCRDIGNLEILYQEGKAKYLTYLTIDLGLQNLQKAVMEGYDEAKYVLCMILVYNEDEVELK